MRGKPKRETKKPKSTDRVVRFLRDRREAITTQNAMRKSQLQQWKSSYTEEPAKQLCILDWAEHMADAYMGGYGPVELEICGEKRRLNTKRRSFRARDLVKAWPDQYSECPVTHLPLKLHELSNVDEPGAAMVDYINRPDGYVSGNLRISTANLAMLRALIADRYFNCYRLGIEDYNIGGYNLSNAVCCSIMEHLASSRELCKFPLTIGLHWRRHRPITSGIRLFSFKSMKIESREFAEIYLDGNRLHIVGVMPIFTSDDDCIEYDIADPIFCRETVVKDLASRARRYIKQFR